MKKFHSLQRQKHGSPVVPATSFDQQTPSFEPIPGHQPITLSGDLQADLQQATRAGWSFENIATTREGLEPEHRYAVNSPEMQRSTAPSEHVMQRKSGEPVVHKENTTGLPDNLKAGVESLSGLSLDDVQVHYNSSKPAEVGALAYAQGTNIHVGPGQEQHLAHEAWHVVQQKQGKVQPTLQVKGISLNDDPTLEEEASVRGAQAFRGAPRRLIDLQLQANQDIANTPVQMNSEYLKLLASFFMSAATVTAVALALDIPQETLVAGFEAIGTAGLTWSVYKLVGYFTNASEAEVKQITAQQPATAQKNLTLKQLKQLAEQDRKKRQNENKKNRKDAIPNATGSLKALQESIAKAAKTIPKEWQIDSDKIGIAEAMADLYREIYRLEAAKSDQHVEALENAIKKYTSQRDTFCSMVTNLSEELKSAANFQRAYSTDLQTHAGANAKACFDRARDMLQKGDSNETQLRGAIKNFIEETLTFTTLDASTLQQRQEANQTTANKIAANYFNLGRISIDAKHPPKFYLTPYDGGYRRFGGEWYLSAADEKLKDIASKWVFHAHCIAGETLEDFTIHTGHIKQKEKSMEVGKSIDITDQAVLQAAQQAGKKTFSEWKETSEGKEVLKSQKRK
jgi:hypothetical protein